MCKICLVQLLFICFQEIRGESLHLQHKSFAKYLLYETRLGESSFDVISSKEFGLHFSSLRLSYSPITSNGMLFYLTSGKSPNQWLAGGIKKGKFFVFIGKEHEQTIRILAEQKVQLGVKHYLSIKRFPAKVQIKINEKNVMNIPLPIVFQKAFDLDHNSSIVLGYLFNSSRQMSFSSSLGACVHQLILNDKMFRLLDASVESYEAGHCEAQSATECERNYCSKNGICKKTIDCSDSLQSDTLLRDGVLIQGKKSYEGNRATVPINKKTQSIEIRFNVLSYVSALIVHCEDDLNDSIKGKFSIQFKTSGEYYNYSPAKNRKVFDIVSFHKTIFLEWPVAVRSIRIRFFDTGKGECRLSLGAEGCTEQWFSSIASKLFPPSNWMLIFKSLIIEEMRTSWNQFGSVYDIEGKDSGSLSDKKDSFPFKNKILDLLPAFNNYAVIARVEFVNRFNLKKISSWMIQMSRCRQNYDKFLLLQLIQQIQVVSSQPRNSSNWSKKCRWVKLYEKPSNLTKAGIIIKVFFRRSFLSTDAFHMLRHTKLSDEMVFSTLLVQREEECAKACMTSSVQKCNAFDVMLGHNVLKKYNCSLAYVNSGHMSTGFYRNILARTYIVKEVLRHHLPISRNSLHQMELPGSSYLGFQCQCVNHMVGTFCDNVTKYDRTYHVITMSSSEEIKINCTGVNSSVVRIQFAMLGDANDVTKSHHPFDLRNENVNTLELVKALCDGKKTCDISMHSFKSFLPPHNFTYMEIRSACEREEPQNLFKQIEVTGSNQSGQKLEDGDLANSANESAICKQCDLNVGGNKFASKEDHDKLNISSLFVFDIFQSEDYQNSSPLMDLSTEKRKYNSSLTSSSKTDLMTAYGTEKIFISSTSLIRNFSCPRIEINGTTFPQSSSGLVSTACPNGSVGQISHQCLPNRTWSSRPLDASRCMSVWISDLSRQVEDSLKGLKSLNTSEIANRQLKNLVTQNESKIYAKDIKGNVMLVERLLHLQMHENHKHKEATAQENYDFARTIQKTTDRLLDSKIINVWIKLSATERAIAAYNLTSAVEKTGLLLARSLANEGPITQKLKNAMFQVTSINNFSALHRNVNLVNLSFPPKPASSKDWQDQAGLLTISFDRETFQQHAVVFALYKEAEKLFGNGFKISDNANEKENLEFSEAAINSHVISATTFGSRNNQAHNIKFVLRHKKSSQNATRCVFWKVDLRKDGTQGSGYWYDEGCLVIRSNRSHTECECVHLTNFAILMDTVGIEGFGGLIMSVPSRKMLLGSALKKKLYYNVSRLAAAIVVDMFCIGTSGDSKTGPNLEAVHELALTFTTWITCVLSIFSLVLSLLCFTLRAVRSVRNSIHKNLTFALLTAQLIFLVGVERTGNQVVCSVIAGFLHYFFLVVFAWMCIEGVHIYVSLVKVFEIDKQSRLRAYYLFAYGLPGVVVTLSAALRYDGYGSKKSCWLASKNDYLIWSFVGPALAVICVNVYFFFVALQIMRTHRIPPTQNSYENAKIWMKRSAVLLCLLGITWIFGVLYVDANMVAMAFIFTLCNGSQGVFIFVFHCLLNERIRIELIKFIRRHRLCPFCLKKIYRNNSWRSNSRSTGSVALKTRRISSRCEELAIENRGFPQEFQQKTTSLNQSGADRDQTRRQSNASYKRNANALPSQVFALANPTVASSSGSSEEEYAFSRYYSERVRSCDSCREQKRETLYRNKSTPEGVLCD